MRFRFQVRETLVTIVTDEGLQKLAKDSIFEARQIIETKISEDPFFGITYDPMPPSKNDDDLVRRMCEASMKAQVGPMAGVAGAVATFTVEKLVAAGARVAVVENGGDIAFYSPKERPVGIFADHPVFRNLAFMVSSDRIIGICSSSRKIGPSVSFGESNVCTVVSDDVILADCCATSLGNRVKSEEDLATSLEEIGSVEGVTGCMACCGDKISLFGDLPEMVKADCSRLV